MRVLVCGECFSPNLGDGLIADAMRQMLGDIPTVDSVGVLDLSGRDDYADSAASQGPRPATGVLRRLHRLLYSRIDSYAALLNLAMNRWLALRGQRRAALLDKFAACDLLIIGGGQLLRDSRLAFPARLATLVDLAAETNLAVVFFGVGVGDRWSTLGRRYFRRALTSPSVDAIYCRDSKSSARLQQELPELAGCVGLTLDAALGSPHAISPPGGKGIGLCIMNPTTVRLTSRSHALASEQGMIRFWVALCERLTAAGHDVRLFTNGAPEDQAMAARIDALLDERDGAADTSRLYSRPLRPDELLRQVRSFEAIIALRLHANIAAYTSGVTTVALEWDDKVRQFMHYSGQGDRFVTTAGDTDTIVEAVCAALDHEIRSKPPDELARQVRRDLARVLSKCDKQRDNTPRAKKLAFFVTEDWYFCSHRLPLAIAARDAGYEVFVITRESKHGDVIRSAGLTLIPVDLVRRSLNPLRELGFIRRLIAIYRRVEPDIVHHVAMKPVLYGTLAARRAGVPAIVNALAGLGFLFSSQSFKARFARPVVRIALRRLLQHKNARLILQNPDDIREFSNTGIASGDSVVLIQGSGVDTSEYSHSPEADGELVVLLASRLLWDKGVAEFVAAAKAIREQGSSARFVIAGDPDDENPNAVPVATVREWQRDGAIEWVGQRDDMPAMFAQSHIVCLPSYREGLPKVLIEAASCGRPIVTTNAPGCREIVNDNINGLLVPVGDAEKLAAAIQRLLDSRELRERLGAAGRKRVEGYFSLETVIGQTLELYQSVVK